MGNAGDIWLLIAGAVLFGTGLALGGSVVLAMHRAAKNERSRVVNRSLESLGMTPPADRPVTIVVASTRHQASLYARQAGLANMEWRYAGHPQALRGWNAASATFVILPGLDWSTPQISDLEFIMHTHKAQGGRVVRVREGAVVTPSDEGAFHPGDRVDSLGVAPAKVAHIPPGAPPPDFED